MLWRHLVAESWDLLSLHQCSLLQPPIGPSPLVVVAIAQVGAYFTATHLMRPGFRAAGMLESVTPFWCGGSSHIRSG